MKKIIKKENFLDKRITSAYRVYEDVKDLFDDEEKRKKLLTTLTKDEIDRLLEEFLICFKGNNDTEKISKIEDWKKNLSGI